MSTKTVVTITAPITRLNLLYHVYPSRKNDLWLQNIQELRQRWNVFTGARVVAAATDAGSRTVDEVLQAFAGLDPQPHILALPNDPQLREVATFLPLLQAVQSTDPTEATFYAHTKANTTAGQQAGAWLWTQRMYATLLDQIQVIRDMLRSHPLVGSCKMVWPRGARPVFPSKLAVGNWMFAGTFFWYRHDRIYSHPRWFRVMPDRYGAEAWPSSIVANHHEAATLYQPWPVEMYPAPSPYDVRTHRGPCGTACTQAVSPAPKTLLGYKQCHTQEASPCGS